MHDLLHWRESNLSKSFYEGIPLGAKKDIGHDRHNTVDFICLLTELIETIASEVQEVVAGCHRIPVGHHTTRLEQEGISEVKGKWKSDEASNHERMTH